MKIGCDFVTNSSSSSYTIGVIGELTEEMLLQALVIEKESPFYSVAKGIAKFVLKDAVEMTLEDLIREYEEAPEDCIEIHSKGMRLFMGEANDQDWDIPQIVLCSLAIDFESDNFMFRKEAWY